MTTQQKIADALGITRQTVSLALRGDRRVNQVTRDRVREAAKAQGYPLTQTYGRRTAVIGVCVPHLRSSEFGELTHAIIRAASDRDHAVVIQETNESYADENKAVRLFKRLNVDGVILTSSRIHVETIANLFETGLKVVSISRQVNAEKLSLEVEGPKIDGRTGTQNMTEYLIALGHRRVCYFEGPSMSTGTRAFNDGYQSALDAHNSANPDHIEARVVRSDATSGDYYQIGWERCKGLLRSPEVQPTAIICYNDEMALGVLKCLKDNNVRVPDDVSVAGTHDIREARYSTPTLTTTRHDKTEYARRVVEMIVGLNDLAIRTREPIVPELVVRGSTGPAPGIGETPPN